MKIRYSTRSLLTLLTFTAIAVGLFAWWLRVQDKIAREAEIRSKKIAEHSELFNEINMYSRSLDPKILQFITTLPGFDAIDHDDPDLNKLIGWQHQTGFQVQDPGLGEWFIQTYDCQYWWPHDPKNDDRKTVDFEISAGYSRQHFNPHVFKLKYVDAENNRVICKFLEDLLFEKYDTKQLNVRHEIVEK